MMPAGGGGRCHSHHVGRPSCLDTTERSLKLLIWEFWLSFYSMLKDVTGERERGGGGPEISAINYNKYWSLDQFRFRNREVRLVYFVRILAQSHLYKYLI